MKATRVESIADLLGDDGIDGGFLLDTRGEPTWRARTPNGHQANLGAHDVVENEDGSITVSPSIRVSNPQEGELYHGHLVAGEWTP